MALVNFVARVEMDEQTIEELHALRAIRIETTKKLLDDLDGTLNDLIEVGNISKDDVTEEFIENLREMLTLKLKVLNERKYQDHFFDDEVALFSDLEASSIEDSLK